MQILIILLGLALLLALTLKKVPVTLAALLSAAFIILFSGMDMLELLEEDFSGGLANFIKSMFLIILLGAIFSKILESTGAANSIARLVLDTLGAKRAILAIILTGAVLTYGGVSNMVSCFAMYPIALDLFRKANLPRYLMPATICAGLYTWACMLPGAPTAGNMAAQQYLGTSITAAPVLGFIAAGVTLVLTLLYLQYEVKKAQNKGIGFISDAKIDETLTKLDQMEQEGKLPHPAIALIPLVCLAVVLIITDSAIIAEFIAIIFALVLFRKNLGGWDTLRTNIETAVTSASSMIITAASIVAIGSVVKVAPGFQTIVDKIVSFTDSGGNPLLIFGVATTLLCGLNASGMGGLTVTLSAMADTFLGMGVSPAVLHRVGVIASTGLDSLPHSGGVVAVHAITGISYKEGYKQVFVTTCVITLVSMFVVIFLGNII